MQMNLYQIVGNWNQLKGAVREEWGTITHNQFDVIMGKRDQSIGKLQSEYGITKAQAERQLYGWSSRNYY
jgi:uncharacterized protein YjbJ (UPF0337 family)